MLSQAAPYLFWLGGGLLVAIMATEFLTGELTDRDPANEPFGDTADGDWVALPEDFKTLFHATENTRGGQ